jgi:NMD protein affecting ribosome stability and mRNA decay
MAIKRFCDRCGRQISDDELSMVVPEYIPTITSYLRIDKDICAKCMTEFITDFWKR